MRVHGHNVEIDWDGLVLNARGTNLDGRTLLNAGTPDGRLEMSPADIDLVAFLDAPRRIGGVLIVVDTTGVEHRMHFRRPGREDFQRLTAELEDAVARVREQQAVVVDLTTPLATAKPRAPHLATVVDGGAPPAHVVKVRATRAHAVNAAGPTPTAEPTTSSPTA